MNRLLVVNHGSFPGRCFKARFDVGGRLNGFILVVAVAHTKMPDRHGFPKENNLECLWPCSVFTPSIAVYLHV